MRQPHFTGQLALLFLFNCPAQAVAQDASDIKFVEVTVVDPDGKPLPGAEVDVLVDDMEFAISTNDQGKTSLNVPDKDNTQIHIRVKHPLYAVDEASWRSGLSISDKLTIKLEQGIPIGGLVHDERGQPIEGVRILARATDTPSNNVIAEFSNQLATTDSQGRWQVRVKQKASSRLQLKLVHDEHLSFASYSQPATWKQLQKLDHVLILVRGIELTGRVTDPDGNPIGGAFVGLGNSRYNSNKLETETDVEGNYHFGNVPKGKTTMTICAEGWAPQLHTVAASHGMESVDYQLQRGRTIRIFLADPEGKPIARAGLIPDSWRGQETLPMHLYRGTTDDEGHWESISMPTDEVQFDVFALGYMYLSNEKLVAREEPYEIVLDQRLMVFGKVTDAKTGQPLEKFDMFRGTARGNGNSQVRWVPFDKRILMDFVPGSGKYQMHFGSQRDGNYVRIEADGYRPEVSRPISSDEGHITIDFEMKKADDSSGIATTPDG